MAAAEQEAEARERTVLLLGNSAPHHQVPVFEPDETIEGRWQQTGWRSEPHPHLRQAVTRMELQPDFDDPEHVERALSTDNDRQLMMIGQLLPDEYKVYAIGIQHIEHTLQVHAGSVKPAWVRSNDPKFAEAVAHFYHCPVGEPIMLLTSVGRDALHQQHMTTGAQPAAFNYMALTASTTAPASGDTVLTGEITTAGGGLVRAQATFAHTAGLNTSTLTKTFTVNSSDSVPVTPAQMGVFNNTAGGTLAYHTPLSTAAPLTTVGDNVTVTETVTGG